MDRLKGDLLYALRQLARSPGFTALALLTLAIGIGANTALFTMAEAILRRPRPGVGEPSTLVWVASTSSQRSRPAGLSYQVAQRIREEVPLLERVATIRDVPLSLSASGGAIKVKGQAVSGDYFALLRARVALGRTLTPSDDVPGGPPVAVLNHQTWLAAFGGDSSIVGRSITLNGLPVTVVGVGAVGFNGAEHDEEVRAAWVPASMLTVLLPEWESMVRDAASSSIRVLARMRARGERAQVEGAIAQLGGAIVAADSTRPKGWQMSLFDASAGMPAGGEASIAPLAALSIAVTGFILLLCCANVSNLMLARAVARQREIATRLAIGASRLRIVRQLLTESIVLAVIATLLALLIASWGMTLVLATALPIPLDVSFDWRVFVVSAALAVTSGLAFGLAPALHATQSGVAQALRDAGTGGGRSRTRLQYGLVVAQVSLSLLLLTMSGLFLRSLDRARRIDVGFDARGNVLALSYDLGLQRYDSARAARFNDALVEQARVTPGVAHASLTTMLPLTEWSLRGVKVAATSSGAPSDGGMVTLSSVHPGYFRTIGTPMLAGRDLTDGDAPGAPRVAVVSEEFARRHAAGRPALGMRVSIDGDEGPWWTVVGVVREAINGTLQTPATGDVYLPLRQNPSNGVTLLVRTTGSDAASLAAPLRATIERLDANLPVFRSMTMAEVRAKATSEQRAGATLLAIFGGIALLLAAIGLHGVVQFAVRQRAREIGIRMALGATGARVTALFVRRGLQLTTIGLAIGIVLSLGATRLARALLLGVSPTDLPTYAFVTTFFAAVALLSCWLPARRAASTDPLQAMRAD